METRPPERSVGHRRSQSTSPVETKTALARLAVPEHGVGLDPPFGRDVEHHVLVEDRAPPQELTGDAVQDELDPAPCPPSRAPAGSRSDRRSGWTTERRPKGRSSCRPGVEPQDYSSPELIAYGQRSRHVTSVRIPVNGRPSPDEFGLVFHIGTPLQDQVGAITPSALHYFGTTRGSFVPDIDPKEHRLLIHGMVDRELIFTMDELKRFPSVTRLHFM